MTVQFKAETRGKLATAVWSVTSFVLLNLLLVPMLIFFFALNRTTVIRRRNVPRRRNTLLLSNHQSMIDSFLVGVAAYYPYHFWKPFLVPWNPAAAENFFRNRFFAWVFDQLKCIPVEPGRRDLKAVYRSMRALRSGTLILFPEGTRSRDGSIGKGRPGAGLVILGNHPEVVPVAIDGMGEVLPVGRVIPNFNRRVYVYFGEPIDYSDFADRPRSRETAQEIVDRVMSAILRQREAIRRLRAIRRET